MLSSTSSLICAIVSFFSPERARVHFAPSPEALPSIEEAKWNLPPLERGRSLARFASVSPSKRHGPATAGSGSPAKIPKLVIKDVQAKLALARAPRDTETISDESDDSLSPISSRGNSDDEKSEGEAEVFPMEEDEVMEDSGS